MHPFYIQNEVSKLRGLALHRALTTKNSLLAIPFAPGASLSVSICRIALCYSMLQSLLYLDGAFVMRFSATTFNSLWLWDADIRQIHYYEAWLTRVSASTWVPKGLVKLFFSAGPPLPQTMYAIVTVAYVSVLCAMIGFCTRLAMPVAVLSVLLVSSIFTSWGAYWSHSFNVVHLAGLAFMFGRSGDRLSVDALIARLLGRSKVAQRDAEGCYRWPVVFGELAVHMFLFAAFWSKYNNGGGIWWALSDNLRNSLAVTWGVYRSHPPHIIDFVMSHMWAFRFVGLAQLFMQSTTIISCTLIRYPLRRACIGGLFMALEILGLAVLFEFYQWLWVPLIAFSIDWDRFWLWLKQRLGGIRLSVAAQPEAQLARLPSPRSNLALPIYMTLFFGYYVANFVFQLGERHLNYPFSSMAFFSGNRALMPYWESSDWTEFRGLVLLKERGSNAPLDLDHIPSGVGELWRAQTAQARVDAVQAIVNTSDLGQSWCLSEQELKGRGLWKPEYGSLRGQEYEVACSYTVPKGNLERVELRFAASVVPAYPAAPLPMRDPHSGLLGIYENGRISALGVTSYIDPETRRWYLEIEGRNLDILEKTVSARSNVNYNRDWHTMPDPVELKGEWQGNRFMLDESEHTDRSVWPLIKIVDRHFGPLIFHGIDLYPNDRGYFAVSRHGKPLNP
jgi:hypothetical protein